MGNQQALAPGCQCTRDSSRFVQLPCTGDFQTGLCRVKKGGEGRGGEGKNGRV